MSSLALLPLPRQCHARDQSFRLTAETSLVATGAARAAAWHLHGALARATGWPWPVVDSAEGSAIRLAVRDEAEATQRLGDEGYHLSVTSDGITLEAATPAGLGFGGQTLLQLLPPDVYRAAAVPDLTWTVPGCEIVDRPRFSWRGLMLDVARHFLPKADVLRFIDVMALHKLNRLHLHLTEDQGWRMEIKRYPRLTDVGAWRSETIIGHAGRPREEHRFDSVPHGGYYTQTDLREIVAYAAQRQIVVVPEIEMPGHARAWISAYPEVGCFPDRRDLQPWTRWGISDDVICPRPATLEMCRHILEEVMDVFPGPWIHTGGDEAPRTHWRESEEVQALIRALGLADEDQLQAWFTGQMSQFLADHGRRLIGWDEILEGGLAPGATVMSWRGERGGIAAAEAGHDVVMSPSPWLYLDNCQGPQCEERIGIGGHVSLAKTYGYDPLPEALPADKHGFILGVQGNLWSEYLPHAGHLNHMAWPRGSAVAEIGWSPAEARDLADFLHRLHHHQARLRALGIEPRPLSRYPVRADEHGRLVCDAKHAMLHGNGLQRQADHLGQWTDGDSFATWEVVVDQPAEVTLAVEVACTGEAVGTSLEVDVAGRTRSAELPDTGAGFVTLELGTVRLTAGRSLVAARAGGPFEGDLTRLKAVVLTPT